MKLYLTILLFTLSAILDASNAQVCTAGQQPKLDYTYIGCYKDVCCGDASEYGKNYLNFIDNTIESCMAIARSKNLAYAALSFGNNCKGGSTYGRFGLADPSACNQPCTANPSQICGGIPDQSVYELYYPVVNETRPCVPCEKGTYSEDGTKCVPAPKGAYVPTNGSSTYINCTRGTYQNQFGQTSCITCDVRKGQLCPNDIMIDPIIVPAGYIANSTLSTITSPCPIATFRASNADATKCEPCFAGTYNDKTGQGACMQAPPGTFTSAGASRSSPCPVGTSTQGLSGQSMCRDCVAGTVSNRTGAYYCTPCELSTQYQDQPGQIQCNTCGPYTFSYKPTEPCQKCGVCKSIYTYLASQSLLGNLKLTENGNDWNVLKDASSVGIDVSYGKAGVLLQLKKCYNVGQFAIDDLKNPNAQCIAAGAPDQVPDINTPPPTTKAPGTPPPVPVPGSNGGVRHTCSFTVFMGVVIVTLMSLAA